MIDSFKNEYSFLSNFYNTPVMYGVFFYRNAEAAFQAAKLKDESKRFPFTSMTASQAKREGRKVPLRDGWEDMKDSVMLEIIRDKFTRNPEMREKLLSTGNEWLVEGNYWHDTYWGVCNGVGENRLGKILMQVRQELFTCEISGWTNF